MPEKNKRGNLRDRTPEKREEDRKAHQKFIRSINKKIKDGDLHKSIAKRYEQMPKSLWKQYTKALNKKSFMSAIGAQCSECVGWEHYVIAIKECPSIACPLYRYRPYQNNQTTEGEDNAIDE